MGKKSRRMVELMPEIPEGPESEVERSVASGGGSARSQVSIIASSVVSSLKETLQSSSAKEKKKKKKKKHPPPLPPDDFGANGALLSPQDLPSQRSEVSDVGSVSSLLSVGSDKVLTLCGLGSEFGSEVSSVAGSMVAMSEESVSDANLSSDEEHNQAEEKRKDIMASSCAVVTPRGTKVVLTPRTKARREAEGEEEEEADLGPRGRRHVNIDEDVISVVPSHRAGGSSRPVTPRAEDPEEALSRELKRREKELDNVNVGILQSKEELYAGHLPAKEHSGKILSGVVLWIDGSRYQGYWMNEQPHVCGVYSYASGNKYHGEYLVGKRHGHGRFMWANTGEVYVGDWMCDQRHGHGVYMWQDGARYEGQWRDGLREGYGIFFWPDGSVYEGQLKGGRRDGWGILTDANLNKFKGIWEQGSLVTPMSFSTPEVVLALENASHHGNIAWNLNLMLPDILQKAEAAAIEACRAQNLALEGCHQRELILNFYNSSEEMQELKRQTQAMIEACNWNDKEEGSQQGTESETHELAFAVDLARGAVSLSVPSGIPFWDGDHKQNTASSSRGSEDSEGKNESGKGSQFGDSKHKKKGFSLGTFLSKK